MTLATKSSNGSLEFSSVWKMNKFWEPLVSTCLMGFYKTEKNKLTTLHHWGKGCFQAKLFSSQVVFNPLIFKSRYFQAIFLYLCSQYLLQGFELFIVVWCSGLDHVLPLHDIVREDGNLKPRGLTQKPMGIPGENLHRNPKIILNIFSTLSTWATPCQMWCHWREQSFQSPKQLTESCLDCEWRTGLTCQNQKSQWNS